MTARVSPRLSRLRGASGPLIAFAWVLANGPGGAADLVSALNNPLITLVNTDRARYDPGATATIYVDMVNRTGSPFSGTVTIAFTHLGDPVGPAHVQSVRDLNADGVLTLVDSWIAPAVDFRGYLITVTARDSLGSVVDRQSSALDVSSDWKRFPRYGYVSLYDTSFDPYHRMWQLKNHHINGVQFYDWQWRHHQPYSAAARWMDIANRSIERVTLTSLITAAHDYGMMAMNYNLWNGAYADYVTDGSGVSRDWGLFEDREATSQKHSVTFDSSWATSQLFLFNPGDARWQNYILSKEREVFDNFGFDGWHIDSLGLSDGYDSSGKLVTETQVLPDFVNGAKWKLHRRVVFNTVGGNGQDELSFGGDVDFLYSEMWEWAQKSYGDIEILVQRAQAHSDKPLVVAGYMNTDASVFNEASVRMVNAVIAAAGASHIELGDGEEMLHFEYFPDNAVKMTDSLRASTMDGYHFLTAYENLLRDGQRLGNAAVTASRPSSRAPRPGAIWTLFRSRPGCDVVHLINLTNNTSADWRDREGTYAAPDPIPPLPIRIYYEGTLPVNARLGFASPDIEHGAATFLPYTTGRDGLGQYVSASVSGLTYWDMLWLEKRSVQSGVVLSSDLSPRFEEDWAVTSGGWSATSFFWKPVVVVASGGGAARYLPGFDTGDYSVEADVLVTSTVGNGAVLGRVQFDGGFYQLEIKDGSTWALYKYDGGSDWRELASGPFSYSADSVHHLKMTLTRNTIRADVDGHFVGGFADFDRPYWRGTVGLRSESQPVLFANVRVTAQ